MEIIDCSRSSDANGDLKSCESCLRRKLSLFSGLKNEELSILDNQRKVIHYKTDETIFKQGTKPTGLLCLSGGKVKISKLGFNGQEQIISLKKPVDFLGLSELLSDEYYSSSAITLEESIVCFVDKSDFDKIIKENKDLALKIIKHFASELIEVNSRSGNLTLKHMRARLADTLLHIEKIYGYQEESNTLDVQLKRSDLAALSNMTTANAIRTISDFSKNGIISVNGRIIKILDLNQLLQISQLG